MKTFKKILLITVFFVSVIQLNVSAKQPAEICHSAFVGCAQDCSYLTDAFGLKAGCDLGCMIGYMSCLS